MIYQQDSLIDQNFLDNFQKVRDKIEAIIELPYSSFYGSVGDKFVGISIEDGIFLYRSVQGRGAYSEVGTFYVHLSEINQPLSFFEDFFKAENDKRVEKMKEWEDKVLERKRQEDLKLLKQLQEKYKDEVGYEKTN
jgi:hypothetical protein